MIIAETWEDLSRAFVPVGLSMNMNKTKIISNAHVVPISVKFGSLTLEAVDDLPGTNCPTRSNF